MKAEDEQIHLGCQVVVLDSKVMSQGAQQFAFLHDISLTAAGAGLKYKTLCLVLTGGSAATSEEQWRLVLSSLLAELGQVWVRSTKSKAGQVSKAPPGVE